MRGVIRALVLAGFGLIAATAIGACKRPGRDVVQAPPPLGPLASSTPPPAPPASLALAAPSDSAPPVPAPNALPEVAPGCRGASFDLDQAALASACAKAGTLEHFDAAAFSLSVAPPDAHVRLGGDVQFTVTLANTSSAPAPLEWDFSCFKTEARSYDAKGERADGGTSANALCARDRTLWLILEPGGTASTKVWVKTLDRHDPASLLKVLDAGKVPNGPYKRGSYEVRIVLPVPSGSAETWLSAKTGLLVK